MNASNQSRRDAILSQAFRGGQVFVRTLAQELGVSESTIRRDLHQLAQQRLLELTHGGAVVVRNADYSFLSKSMQNVQAKRIIAQLASQLISDGDQIFLGSGTTCFALAAELRGKRALSVIVQSIRTAQELQVPGLNVVILGGQYRPDRMDTVGPVAAEVLEKFRGYTAFIGTDGMSMDFGTTSVDIESAHILSIAARNARACVLLADSSKFDRPSLYKVLDFKMISTVVTEQQPQQRWLEFFENMKIQVVFPQNRL